MSDSFAPLCREKRWLHSKLEKKFFAIMMHNIPVGSTVTVIDSMFPWWNPQVMCSSAARHMIITRVFLQFLQPVCGCTTMVMVTCSSRAKSR